MSSENLDTPEMNGHPESLSDMNGHPDTFAATPETKGPSGEAASPAIQIDIPLSDPSGDTKVPNVTWSARLHRRLWPASRSQQV